MATLMNVDIAELVSLFVSGRDTGTAARARTQGVQESYILAETIDEQMPDVVCVEAALSQAGDHHARCDNQVEAPFFFVVRGPHDILMNHHSAQEQVDGVSAREPIIQMPYALQWSNGATW